MHTRWQSDDALPSRMSRRYFEAAQAVADATADAAEKQARTAAAPTAGSRS